MGKSRFIAPTTLVGLLGVAPAYAADLAPIPVKYREAEKLPWAGLYVGANAGFAWSSDPRTDCTFAGPGLSPCVPNPTAFGVPTGSAFPTVNSAGAEYGLQAGYNWQVANWVLGFEADINKLAAQGNTHFAGVDPGKGPDQLSQRYDWLGTARGRAGITAGSALFYATGGFAYGRTNHEYIYGLGSPANTQTFGLSELRTGWTAGGGAEYAFNQHWSVKAEYLYVHLAASNLNISNLNFVGNFFTGPAGTTILHFNNNLNIVRIGANYRF
jgi:outer membrane immunogenic protein